MTRILEWGESPDSHAFNALNPPCNGAIILIDDGTLDTVFTCSRCHRMFRYTFDGDMPYRQFVAWASDDASSLHEDS